MTDASSPTDRALARNATIDAGRIDVEIDGHLMSRNADRPDLHNSEVDELVAAHGLCGTTHLNTGDICRLPERHEGGCDFSPRKDARTD